MNLQIYVFSGLKYSDIMMREIHVELTIMLYSPQGRKKSWFSLNKNLKLKQIKTYDYNVVLMITKISLLRNSPCGYYMYNYLSVIFITWFFDRKKSVDLNCDLSQWFKFHWFKSPTLIHRGTTAHKRVLAKCQLMRFTWHAAVRPAAERLIFRRRQ